MAKVGAQRAATLTGKSKSTVQRAMNSGKLSFELDQNKRRVIDVSELERVFGIKQQNVKKTTPVKVEAKEITEVVEKERMKMQIKMLEQQLSVAEDRLDDLMDQRDKWERQASQVLITSQYSQKQAEELRAQIKEREERVRQRRLQHTQMQNAQTKGVKKPTRSLGVETRSLDEKMKRLKAQNENDYENSASVFRFWKKARG